MTRHLPQLVIVALVFALALGIATPPVLAQTDPTTTTSAPTTTTTTQDPCQWEHGGIVESPAQPCEQDGDPFTRYREEFKLAMGLLIFTAAGTFALLAFKSLR